MSEAVIALRCSLCGRRFPTLPDRGQFNRLLRRHADAVVACLSHMVPLLQAQPCLLEGLDGTTTPIRDAKRRGLGQAARCGRYRLQPIGWAGMKAFAWLVAVNPIGA